MAEWGPCRRHRHRLECPGRLAQDPAAVIAELRQDVIQVLHEPDIQPKYQAFGYARYFPTDTDFKQFMVDESQRFGDVIRRGNLSL